MLENAMNLPWICVFINCVVLSGGRKNVLFLIADDMRAELSSYNGRDFPSSIHPPMFTPNLDALAAKSLLLKRAYVQQALCSPSRTSVLTGRRPDTTHVYDLHTYFRDMTIFPIIHAMKVWL
jgi:iduronate 2-sulfatase